MRVRSCFRCRGHSSEQIRQKPPIRLNEKKMHILYGNMDVLVPKMRANEITLIVALILHLTVVRDGWYFPVSRY